MLESEPENSSTLGDRKMIIPTIVGEGSGRGYFFRDLYLPKEWRKVISSPKDTIHQLLPNYKRLCQKFNFIPGNVEVDGEIGLLTKLSIDTDPKNTNSIS